MDESAAMLRAALLAEEHLGRTHPNPAVGCVLLGPQGELIADGAHVAAGLPHAEALALAAAGTRSQGATAVVTLEPCAHTGRTGPCAQALIDAGVSRVVIAVPDPLHGGGAALLAAAGIDVDYLPLAEAMDVSRAWRTWAETGRPEVTVKWAATLDGRAAAADHSSQWITSEAARADVHRLRIKCDAIMAGIGTVLADNPRLTARDAEGRERDHQPLRVIVDSQGRTPAAAAVRTAPGQLHIATSTTGHVNLGVLLDKLGQQGITSVLVEGGPTLVGALVAADLVDRVIAYIAPLILGAGTSVVGHAGILTLADARHLRIVDVTPLGGDIRITAVRSS